MSEQSGKPWREFFIHKKLNHSYNAEEIPDYRDKSEYIHAVIFEAFEASQARVRDLEKEIDRRNHEAAYWSKEEIEAAKIRAEELRLKLFGNEVVKERIQALEKENAELKWFADRMNEYVMPGTTDSQNSAIRAFKELGKENAELRSTLDKAAELIGQKHFELREFKDEK